MGRPRVGVHLNNFVEAQESRWSSGCGRAVLLQAALSRAGFIVRATGSLPTNASVPQPCIACPAEKLAGGGHARQPPPQTLPQFPMCY